MSTLSHLRRTTLISAAALSLATLAVAASAATGDPNLHQTVDSDEAIGDEQVVVDEGHVDLGPRIIDGQWQLLARDDSQAPPVWRYPGDLVMHVDADSVLPAPDDEDFSFIDAEAGADVFVIPQTESTDVVWVGWNSQDPAVVEQLTGGMTLRLHGVTGPGQFTLFLQNGNFDPPQLLWDSDVSEPQDIWAESNTHVHGNWVFTEPGIYLLDVEVLGEHADGTTASDRDYVRFAVGDIDPQEAFDAAPPTADATTEDDAVTTDETAATSTAGPDGASESGAAHDTAAEDADQGGAVPTALLIAGGAALVVAVGVVVAVLRSRRARLAADTDPNGPVRSGGTNR